MSGMRSVETVVVARAVAIILVVANHVVFGISLHGGLNALLVVSGLAMAQFGFGGPTDRAARAMIRFGFRLALPSFLLALVWQIAVGHVSLPELGFWSNWLYKFRVALFPIWYAQAIVQMLVMLVPLFLLTDMGARIARRPLFWVGTLYAAACGLALASYAVWDTTYLADKLPHLILWNLLFGWLIWAVRASSLPKTQGRWLLTGVLALSVGVLFLGVDAFGGPVRAIYFPLIVLPVIWLDRISMPAVLARATLVVSQATLFIFLFHYYAFWGVWRIGRMIGFELEAQNPFLRLGAGLILPILLWAGWTAALRVYRRRYRLGAGDPRPVSTGV